MQQSCAHRTFCAEIVGHRVFALLNSGECPTVWRFETLGPTGSSRQCKTVIYSPTVEYVTYMYVYIVYIVYIFYVINSRANKIANKKRMRHTVISGLLPKFSNDWDQEEWLVGGWPTPLKNMKVNWGYYSQYMEKNIFQTTNKNDIDVGKWLIDGGYALALHLRHHRSECWPQMPWGFPQHSQLRDHSTTGSSWVGRISRPSPGLAANARNCAAIETVHDLSLAQNREFDNHPVRIMIIMQADGLMDFEPMANGQN